MKPFRSPEEVLDAHELMFGEAGRQCAEVVLRWATTLFTVPLDALNIRVVLAPVELQVGFLITKLALSRSDRGTLNPPRSSSAVTRLMASSNFEGR
jgi:hypothetical protein